MKRVLFMLAMSALIFLALFQPLFGAEDSFSHPLDSHLSEKYKDDLDGLMAKRYIRVLTTLNKTNYFLHKGKPFGYEYALLREYEKFLNKGGKSRGLRVVVEFIPVSRDRLISGLIEGYGDIAAAGLTITEERLKQVDFTIPYWSGIDEVLVTHKQVKTPQSLEDLSGQRIFVRRSSSYYESLMELNRSLKKQRKRPVKVVNADENLETEDILELVNAGVIEMTVSDSHVATIWSGLLKNLVVHEEIKLRSDSKIAWMVRKNNPQLKASLNKFLKEHKKGTLLGNIYFQRYYEKNPWIQNPLGRKDKKKLDQYRSLFQKYAKQYGFDWLLIMAMAYQESGLDNSKKSRSGAVGIMQVRPATAKDKNIGIRDVHLLENNIHAGVKYLAFLRDRYFNDEAIRQRDRVRLALASYNAGPAKIRRARALAQEKGLNPNRWFRNVELATLQSVGREPVRYVSNINKYYVTYQLAEEKTDIREKAKEKIK
ncbi:MAG: transporter substrate-binding domain-containing protein [Deltaproteobacteria bacterium]|nr:MAG: transporter substrate-binding domain-containing protein [Deltaproteobacteria bacterium]